MEFFDNIKNFFSSSCWDRGEYILITFFIALLFVSQFSLLIVGLGKAFAGRFALEYLTLFFNILGNVYSFSGIEDALSSNCPKLDSILKVCRMIGYILLFIKFVKEGGLELLLDIVDFFLDVFNTRIFTFKGRSSWGSIKVLLLWVISKLIAIPLSQIMSDYIRWLCQCVF